MLALLMIAGVASAQDYGTMGISDVVATADRKLQRGDYRGAIPALNEVIRRTENLTDPQGMDTCQTCRFQLARSMYMTGNVSGGMKVLQTYLDKEPRKKEVMALRMMAQGFFETKEWGKIEKLGERLLARSDLNKDDRYNANLLLGQALFRQKKWAKSVKPLTYAANHAKEDRVKALCQIMAVRSLVESKNWRLLFGRLPGIYRTDSKYDISLNLTLMKAGKTLFEEEDYLNSLLLYRWVLPREDLIRFAEKKVSRLNDKLLEATNQNLPANQLEDRQNEITDLEKSMRTLRDLPPYEDEVTFRIGQIYAQVKRYWEGYVLFDKLYRQDRASEIGEASMLQSVLILYDVGETVRAEERVVLYLTERPDGQYARTLLSMMIRDNLMRQDFNRVVECQQYVDALLPTEDPDELLLQADLHYMLAFGYFQIKNKDYKTAGSQFSIIIRSFPDSPHFHDARYYRGMTFMLQGDYGNALEDFVTFQKDNEHSEHYPSSLFREAVCLFGLSGIEPSGKKAADLVVQSENAFTRYIETCPDDPFVSEGFSLRGDIEAAKEASNEDPYTLDRALADYRKGIDKANTSAQASYPAFQAAKVYKLESKWQEIIDLMNYYMDRWEEKADVAEAVFWIGQAQIELDQVGDAVNDYLSAIIRFGNDPAQTGVDKIMHELVKVANVHLSEEDRDALAVKVKQELTNIDPREKVLNLRLRVTQTLLEGEDIAAAFGATLLQSDIDLEETSPASLSLMCEAAIATGNLEQMEKLAKFFIENFEESELVWHAYKALTFKYLAEKNYKDVLWTIEEAQGMFGADAYMGWAQITKADTEYTMGKYLDAFASYNMCMGVAEWRGSIQAEAIYGMGQCKLKEGVYDQAHSFFQRAYLLYKNYNDGDWAAKGYIAAADALRKLGREDDAINTLKDMLKDEYTKDNPLAEPIREQLKKLGVELGAETNE